MTIMLPIRTTFVQWANDLNRSCPSLNIPFPSKGIKNWREWVNNLIDTNRLYTLPSATASRFPNEEDWKKWAFLFIQNVQTTQLAG